MIEANSLSADERERREEDGRERKITEENTDSRLKKEIIQTE